MVNVSNYKKSWSDSQLEQLRNMVAIGKTTKEIMVFFSKTRNSIIGICHREGVAYKNSRNITAPKKPRKKERTISVARFRFKEPLSDRNGIKLSIRTPFECSYILGEPKHITCCGKLIHRGAFCKEHADICYVVVRAK